MANSTDIEEWLKVCKDELLHKKCKMIKCYETVGDSPQELLLMFSTYEPDALKLLSRDFGEDWDATWAASEQSSTTPASSIPMMAAMDPGFSAPAAAIKRPLSLTKANASSKVNTPAA